MRYRQQQYRADRRAVFTAWLLTIVHRSEDAPNVPFPLEEVTRWLGHGFEPPEESQAPQPPDPEAQMEATKRQIELLNALYEGADLRGQMPSNGHHQGDSYGS